MSSPTRYYYVDAQNQAAGPIPLGELLSLHAAGTITEATLVVVEGGQDWVAFSTIKPASPAPAAASPASAVQVTAKPSASASFSSSVAEPAWATQLLQKIDQLTLTAEKIVAAIEKNAPRQIAAPAPATAALHAEKVNLNPIPKPGLAQPVANNVAPTAAPAAVPRPGVATPLAPLAVPANAVKPGLPLPALGKPGTPAPAAVPGKPGNLFSKFLKK